MAFKPDTDDIRDAPALDIVKGLLDNGAKLNVYDPEAMENFRKHFPESNQIKYFDEKYDTLKNADALLIITEWKEFKEIDINKVKELLKLPIVIDGRNILNPQTMQEKGFEYHSIGR